MKHAPHNGIEMIRAAGVRSWSDCVHFPTVSSSCCMALMAVAPSIFSGQQMAVTFQGANLKTDTMPSRLQTRFDLVKIIVEHFEFRL